MLKYYTFVFLPEEYGMLSIYNSILQYVVLFIGLNMSGYSMRLYWDFEGEARKDYLATILAYLLASSTIALTVGLIFGHYIVDFIKPGTFLIFYLGVIGSCVFVVGDFFLKLIKIQYQSKKLLSLSISSSVINHVSSVGLISLFGLGITGRQLGKLLGSMSLVYGSYRNSPIYKHYRFTFNSKALKETIYLAIPSVINTGQSLLINYFDQVYIKIQSGLGDVGIYSLAFFISRSISLVIEGITSAMAPITFYKLKTNYEEAISELERVSYKYFLFLIMILILITSSSKVLISLIATVEYSRSAEVLSILIYGYGLAGFYKIPSMILGFHKKVKLYPVISFVSAASNIGLNIIMIPEYGIIGAAFASLFSLAIYSLGVLCYAQKYLSIKFKIIYVLYHLSIIISLIFLKIDHFLK